MTDLAQTDEVTAAVRVSRSRVLAEGTAVMDWQAAADVAMAPRTAAPLRLHHLQPSPLPASPSIGQRPTYPVGRVFPRAVRAPVRRLALEGTEVTRASVADLPRFPLETSATLLTPQADGRHPPVVRWPAAHGRLRVGRRRGPDTVHVRDHRAAATFARAVAPASPGDLGGRQALLCSTLSAPTHDGHEGKITAFGGRGTVAQ